MILGRLVRPFFSVNNGFDCSLTDLFVLLNLSQLAALAVKTKLEVDRQ